MGSVESLIFSSSSGFLRVAKTLTPLPPPSKLIFSDLGLYIHPLIVRDEHFHAVVDRRWNFRN
jgi:hypothetical protein